VRTAIFTGGEHPIRPPVEQDGLTANGPRKGHVLDLTVPDCDLPLVSKEHDGTMIKWAVSQGEIQFHIDREAILSTMLGASSSSSF
jgi:hypothetical protein